MESDSRLSDRIADSILSMIVAEERVYPAASSPMKMYYPRN